MAKKPPTFILLGAAGYVAPRHMAAIKAVGGELVAAVDPNDSVGVLDQYFPKCAFYHAIGDIAEKADYLVVCSPNYLHFDHILAGFSADMKVIVEKPAVLTCDQLDRLQPRAAGNSFEVNCILNMRLHHDAQLLKAMVAQISDEQLPAVDIQYHTPRGPWYWQSWKANRAKSGGMLFNIGVHLIDLALWVFGPPSSQAANVCNDRALINLCLERANVFANLSINSQKRQRTFKVGYAEFDFTNGFEDLHVESYRQILAGNGFTLQDARPAIEVCERLSKP